MGLSMSIIMMNILIGVLAESYNRGNLDCSCFINFCIFIIQYHQTDCNLGSANIGHNISLVFAIPTQSPSCALETGLMIVLCPGTTWCQWQGWEHRERLFLLERSRLVLQHFTTARGWSKICICRRQKVQAEFDAQYAPWHFLTISSIFIIFLDQLGGKSWTKASDRHLGRSILIFWASWKSQSCQGLVCVPKGSCILGWNSSRQWRGLRNECSWEGPLAALWPWVGLIALWNLKLLSLRIIRPPPRGSIWRFI